MASHPFEEKDSGSSSTSGKKIADGKDEEADSSVREATPKYRIALHHWGAEGSIGESIADELKQLGHEVRRLLVSDPVRTDVDIVFTYAPYGRWMQIPRQLSRIPEKERPFLVHWNTEGLPPPFVPPAILKTIGGIRSWLDEIIQRFTANTASPAVTNLDGFFKHRMLRYRYIGDYLQARRLKIPFLLVDISDLYARRYARMDIESINVPFGTSSRWYADLDLPRDIDVLWIGSHGSWRRSRQLERIGRALARHGVRFHMVDGREVPFVHGDERTVLLNRTKIVLNLMRTPYDDNTLRHFIAMPNRALVVSEPMLRHNTDLLPDVHYVEAPLADLPETIRKYLDDEDLRTEIVERAYAATTGELSMKHMIGRILYAVSKRLSQPSTEIPN